jgi:hypothetical protein
MVMMINPPISSCLVRDMIFSGSANCEQRTLAAGMIEH